MLSSRRFPGLLRPTVAFLLYMCAWATFPPAYARQGASADGQSFAAVTRRAIARGRAAEAEALAKQRPAGDPAAAQQLEAAAQGLAGLRRVYVCVVHGSPGMNVADA